MISAGSISIRFQASIEVVAGGAIHRVVIGDTDLLPVSDVFQALLEQFEVERLPALGMDPLRFTFVPVGQEIVQFDGSHLLTSLPECNAQPLHDLRLACRGRPGDRQQDRRPAERDDLPHAFHEKRIDLIICPHEILVPHGSNSFCFGSKFLYGLPPRCASTPAVKYSVRCRK
jgi:hypothetical protein